MQNLTTIKIFGKLKFNIILSKVLNIKITDDAITIVIRYMTFDIKNKSIYRKYQNVSISN